MKRSGYNLAAFPAMRTYPLNTQSPQYSGLAGLWSFQPSGHTTVIRDLVNGNDATTPGTIGTHYGWQESDSGFLGTGVYQPGSTNNVWDCGNDARLQVSANGLTVCIWVRLYQNLGSTSYPGIFGKGDSDSSTQGSYLVYMTTNKLNSLLYSGSARVNSLTGATSLDFQTHYHFALTWQPGVRTSIFVNGIRDATTTTSVPTTLDNPAYNFLIGSNQGGVTKSKYPFRGMLYEARLYNICKSDDEIYQMYAPQTRWDVYRSPQKFNGWYTAPMASFRMPNDLDLHGLSHRIR